MKLAVLYGLFGHLGQVSCACQLLLGPRAGSGMTSRCHLTQSMPSGPVHSFCATSKTALAINKSHKSNQLVSSSGLRSPKAGSQPLVGSSCYDSRPQTAQEHISLWTPDCAGNGLVFGGLEQRRLGCHSEPYPKWKARAASKIDRPWPKWLPVPSRPAWKRAQEVSM